MANTGISIPSRHPELSAELKLIPRWSVALAALAFVGVQYLWWVVIPAVPPPSGPPGGHPLLFRAHLERPGCSLHADDRLRQPGCATPHDERADLDAGLLRHARQVLEPCSTSCCASPSSPLARPAAPGSRATTTSAPSAPAKSPRPAATAIAAPDPRISSAFTAAMTSQRTACPRASATPSPDAFACSAL